MDAPVPNTLAATVGIDYDISPWERTIGPWAAGRLRVAVMRDGITAIITVEASGELKYRAGAVAGMIYLKPVNRADVTANRFILWKLVKATNSIGTWTYGPDRGKTVTPQEYWKHEDFLNAEDEWQILADETLTVDAINRRSAKYGGDDVTNYELLALSISA